MENNQSDSVQLHVITSPVSLQSILHDRSYLQACAMTWMVRRLYEVMQTIFIFETFTGLFDVLIIEIINASLK